MPRAGVGYVAPAGSQTGITYLHDSDYEFFLRELFAKAKGGIERAVSFFVSRNKGWKSDDWDGSPSKVERLNAWQREPQTVFSEWQICCAKDHPIGTPAKPAESVMKITIFGPRTIADFWLAALDGHLRLATQAEKVLVLRELWQLVGDQLKPGDEKEIHAAVDARLKALGAAAIDRNPIVSPAPPEQRKVAFFQLLAYLTPDQAEQLWGALTS